MVMYYKVVTFPMEIKKNSCCKKCDLSTLVQNLETKDYVIAFQSPPETLRSHVLDFETMSG